MNDSQRRLVFWLFLAAAPVAALYMFGEIGKIEGLLVGLLVLFGLGGAAFYVRAGGKKE